MVKPGVANHCHIDPTSNQRTSTPRNVIHIEHYDNSPQWYKRKQEDY